jgi:hypothetical protein
MRQDRRYTSTDLLAFDQRYMPDSHAMYIGDGIPPSRREDARGNAQFTNTLAI